MEARNCKGCNRLFNYIGGLPLCTACKEALEAKFVEVKEYIYENPKSSVKEVAEANDVSVKQIKQWIREDRLILSEPSADGVVCERCGTPICSGRFCETCKVKISNNMERVLDRPRTVATEQARRRHRDGNKMRFLSNEE